MTRRATITESQLRRVIKVARIEGKELAECLILPDGTVRVIFDQTQTPVDAPKAGADDRQPGAW